MENIKVYVENVDGLSLPFYANETDAGMDVRASEDIIIAPGQTVIIKTGLKIALPIGFEVQVRPRSGCSFKTPLRVANAPGTIDAGYRDEIGVIITNTSKDYFWEKDSIKKMANTEENTFAIDEKGNRDGFYHIKKGDRIAQLVLCHIYKAEFEVIDDVSTIGENRGGGFGHSGVK